jgi:CRP-like cAMP-binding protein
MGGCASIPDLLNAFEQHCIKVHKPKSTVLFRRGRKSFGMFVLFSGEVTLDFENEGTRTIDHTYGPGALLGLPATLTKRAYTMTAIVAEDAELGFIPYRTLESLLRDRSDICQLVLLLLSERISESQRIAKLLLSRKTRRSPLAHQSQRTLVA